MKWTPEQTAQRENAEYPHPPGVLRDAGVSESAIGSAEPRTELFHLGSRRFGRAVRSAQRHRPG
jgi:hypothetical protein